MVSIGALRSRTGRPLVGQDTLKLHVGEVAWISETGRSKRTAIGPGNPIRLSPGDIATVITQEEISIPLDLTGCVYPRGRLLPLGVLSTAVHMDPGFEGRCRVIMMNLGRNVVDLPYGYEIARLQLVGLSEKVITPYAGVNAELDSVNPQADELVADVDFVQPVEKEVEKLSNRVQELESFVSSYNARRRTVRISLACISAICVSTLILFLAVVTARAVTGNLTKDLVFQISSIIVTALIALGVGAARSSVGNRISSWIANDINSSKSSSESLE
ncbi:dCTP deaminase domain-containing protein [Nocardia sp. CA-135398]|uniref:dCTP deaminase domain-containing protein n=1 Tax=Nocardia sp. CA-135398 TaxID=3239977 RepID=UPI003D981099